MRSVFRFIVLFSLFIASCTVIEKKQFDFSEVKLHGSWGTTKAYLEHVVLAEDLDKMKLGTFFLSLSGTTIDPDVDRVKIVSARLRRADNDKIAYEFDPRPEGSDYLTPSSPFYFGRIRLEYVDYKIDVTLDISRGEKVDHQQVSGVFSTQSKSHKTFSYWEALKGI